MAYGAIHTAIMYVCGMLYVGSVYDNVDLVFRTVENQI